VIYAEIFLWLTHQKLDWPENFWCNFRNWEGGNYPIAPPGYVPGPWKYVWRWFKKCHYFFSTSSFWDICMFSLPLS